MVELTLVVPCYNEELRLPESLRRLGAFLETRGPGVELILVDDGSSDGTAAVIRAAQAKHACVRQLQLSPNQGKGAAVAAGVAVSRGRQVLISDADFSTPIEELSKLEDAVAVGADVAIGSRAARGARDRPLHRQAMGKVFNLMVQTILLPGISDTQCGFKLFLGEVARELFADLRTTGFAFDVEVLHRARRAGYRVTEVPVRWVNSSSSRVSAVRDTTRMLYDLLLLRLA
ncbi:MAG: glycosyltransferase family 2 protein [Candidatus Dormibacteraeota bacterium]|nr:glycosyltransferase family 2 protein [Candidatus Dormibacteraeota bacterium]